MKTVDKLLIAGSYVGLAFLGVILWIIFSDIKDIKEHLSDTIILEEQPVPDPVDTPKKKTKKLLIKGSKINLTEREKVCLARNIFYEAGVEDEAGKIAVAQVTLNRLKSGRWGDDLCKVVHARKQFSWTLEKKKLYGKPDGKLWTQSLEAKQKFLEGRKINGLDDSLFYHTDYIKAPVWTRKMKSVAKIGQHIFYKEQT